MTLFKEKGKKTQEPEAKQQGARRVDSEVVLSPELAQIPELRAVQNVNRWLMLFVGGLLGCLLMTLLTIMVLVNRPPVPGETVAMDYTGQKVKLQAFTSVGPGVVRLNNFTSAVAAEMLSFNFETREKKMAELREDGKFTTAGFSSYRSAIENSRVALYMDTDREVWMTTAVDVPVIAKDVSISALRRWEMHIVVLTKRTPKNKTAIFERRRVTMIVLYDDAHGFTVDSVGWEKVDS
jgi:hypothetical protein